METKRTKAFEEMTKARLELKRVLGLYELHTENPSYRKGVEVMAKDRNLATTTIKHAQLALEELIRTQTNYNRAAKEEA